LNEEERREDKWVDELKISVGEIGFGFLQHNMAVNTEDCINSRYTEGHQKLH
jgi:hypothetical protein